eukprot:TRINITY_DN5330_c5_g1_i1.p1 TRINITY_DN5330_c5_g1~~TRINITY_DN5330_c5_g1_i1.p1  ORF type:complete len:367 (-),score=-47.85 TRINITY_DN5330_c5_g1_i1:17-1117(-)
MLAQLFLFVFSLSFFCWLQCGQGVARKKSAKMTDQCLLFFARVCTCFFFLFPFFDSLRSLFVLLFFLILCYELVPFSFFYFAFFLKNFFLFFFFVISSETTYCYDFLLFVCCCSLTFFFLPCTFFIGFSSCFFFLVFPPHFFFCTVGRASGALPRLLAVVMWRHEHIITSPPAATSESGREPTPGKARATTATILPPFLVAVALLLLLFLLVLLCVCVFVCMCATLTVHCHAPMRSTNQQRPSLPLFPLLAVWRHVHLHCPQPQRAAERHSGKGRKARTGGRSACGRAKEDRRVRKTKKTQQKRETDNACQQRLCGCVHPRPHFSPFFFSFALLRCFFGVFSFLFAQLGFYVVFSFFFFSFFVTLL